jgi:hypothetical protein
MIEVGWATRQRGPVAARQAGDDIGIVRGTRSLFKLTVAVVTGGALVLLGRRLAQPASPVRHPGSQETQSLGGSLRADSIRALHAAVLRHIQGRDSYIPAMLAEGDSTLKRWPDRSVQGVDVYLGAAPPVQGYTAEKREQARQAFVRWERVAAIPVRFEFVNDSAMADVRVRWVERFPIRRAGQADITWNRGGWIVRGTLTLATRTWDGRPLSDQAVYTVALHEIGHLLGLGHSDDPHDVMYPSTEVHDITARDRHTARLLYSVPPGSVRLGPTGG